MGKESETGPIHQYCLSIRNQKLLSGYLKKTNQYNLFQEHRLIQSSDLNSGSINFFETWLDNILRKNSIQANSLRLDYIGEFGTLNYAIFADSRLRITDKLKTLNGFVSVDDLGPSRLFR